MPWLLSEYLLKGVYLGLLLFAALQRPGGDAAVFFLCTLGGLVLFLGIAAGRKLREGHRVTGRLPVFLLFLLLESPGQVYAGVLLGAAGGALVVRQPGTGEWLTAMFAGGAGLGVLFWLLRHVALKPLRVGLGLLLAGGVALGLLYGLMQSPDLRESVSSPWFGLHLLFGIPIFYLLTFAGTAEESEVEIAATCAALGLGLWTLAREYFHYQSICLLVPLVLYFWYSTRVLPKLRVFKHVFRGIGHAGAGKGVAGYRAALLAFRRALHLDPANALAREQFWRLHRAMDWNELLQDPPTLALVDLNLCLERTASLLLLPAPGAEKLKEAHHLLDLVLRQQPSLKPLVSYWRAVAHTHAKLYDQAASELAGILDPTGFASDDPYRANILFSAWQLALTLHPELERRVGIPQLSLPGRRLEAIAAVERQLAEQPADAAAWGLKRVLYSALSEEEWRVGEGEKGRKGERESLSQPAAQARVSTLQPPASSLRPIDYGYVEQLGLALIDDPGRWQRGAEYLRIAAHGLPERGPSIYQQISLAHERAGKPDEVRRYHEQGREAGRAVGPANLDAENRQAYFTMVKSLAEQAAARGDLGSAIENYQLYTEYERSGVETLRTLADLHERQGNALAALRVTEQALLYNGGDTDLLQRKEKYYYSITPAELRAHLETMGRAFDADYCLRKARTLLDFKELDADTLAWAEHLAELAQIVRPESVTAKVLRGRALRRRGEIEPARTLWEEARASKPGTFTGGEEEEAWFLACRLLGETYLYDLGRPDLAVPCFQDFRQSPKSGADTLYKLGQAYEQIGDRAKAAKCYEHVIAYEAHPLAPDARAALERTRRMKDEG